MSERLKIPCIPTRWRHTGTGTVTEEPTMAPPAIVSGREGDGGESPLMGDDISSSPSLETFVAPILLSLAKDARYVSQLSTLLSDVVRPYLPSSSNNINNNSSNNEERLDPEWTLLASILYVLFMLREGRSLGMEFTSLEFASTTSHNNGDSSGQGLWGALSTNNNKNSSKKVSSTALTLLRAVAFGMLYTIPPYLFRRAARGGWDEVRNLWTTLFHHGGGTIPRRNQHVNDERLRGSDRRRVFLEQRRLMTERSLHPQQHSTQSNSTTTTTTTDTPITNNSTDAESQQLDRTQSSLSPPLHHQNTSSLLVSPTARLDRIRHRLWSLLRVGSKY
eukprot:scaffold1274_cov60-Attheya_sp.AAC.3